MRDGIAAVGDHALRWDGTDEAGQQLATGIYFARLTSGGTQRSVSRLTLLR